jgi:hypothetical protein
VIDAFKFYRKFRVTPGNRRLTVTCHTFHAHSPAVKSGKRQALPPTSDKRHLPILTTIYINTYYLFLQSICAKRRKEKRSMCPIAIADNLGEPFLILSDRHTPSA